MLEEGVVRNKINGEGKLKKEENKEKEKVGSPLVDLVDVEK
jgi:hypothetical protein